MGKSCVCPRKDSGLWCVLVILLIEGLPSSCPALCDLERAEESLWPTASSASFALYSLMDSTALPGSCTECLISLSFGGSQHFADSTCHGCIQSIDCQVGLFQSGRHIREDSAECSLSIFSRNSPFSPTKGHRAPVRPTEGVSQLEGDT